MKAKSTSRRIIQFLKLLEEKLPRGNWAPPILNAVQYQRFAGGVVSRSVTNAPEKTWQYAVALTIGSATGPMTLFLTDDDLDKASTVLVKQVLSVIAKNQVKTAAVQ